MKNIKIAIIAQVGMDVTWLMHLKKGVDVRVTKK